MELAKLFREFETEFEHLYGHRLRPSHRRAMTAIMACRTPDAGQLIVHCPLCNRSEHRSHSCGHRHCPRCQNHETTVWLERQRAKLIPVPYFLVTFTVPAELRNLAWHNQATFFNRMFQAATTALGNVAGEEQFLGGQIGMTGVLHTHSRRLDFHPHIHFIVPAGAIDPRNRTWRRKDWQFLVPQNAIAHLFRKRFLALLRRDGLPVPGVHPARWVAHCKHVGSGKPALDYLSRYLYRGVIAEKYIARTRDGHVVFRYRDNKTRQWFRVILSGPDFLWRVLQHVLPHGFRRARDFGFLHGNAGDSLRLVQLLLHAKAPVTPLRGRTPFCCSRCQTPMTIIARRVPPPAFSTRAPP
jgi:hypothetical protein